MKLQTNNSLINSIISSDFFLLNKKSILNNHISKRVQLKDSKMFESLELLQLLKSLKQFIRLLQFLNSQPASLLNISVENKQYLLLLKSFFDNNLFKNIKIENSFSSTNKNTTQLALILGDSFLKNELLLKKCLVENIYLVHQINNKNNLNNFCTYKIFNNLDDFKKLIFLMVLISNLLKKN